tara:strand:- start:104 stop:340 length:237 start_codon:yes stop_codon:yes gene_type:complete
MCLGRRPKPPQLPPKQPVDSAIEETADTVAVGKDRPTKKKKTKGVQQQTTTSALGTKSLQIPLLNPNQTGAGNLKYPA